MAGRLTIQHRRRCSRFTCPCGGFRQRYDQPMRIDSFGRIRPAGTADGRLHYFCSKCGNCQSRAKRQPALTT